MNKPAIATILATAALSIAKKASGSRSQGITVDSLDELIRHANDHNLAPLVTTVFLEEEYLTEMPPEIGNLINLETLELYDNVITSIPPEIGNLINLETLELDNNQITSIPPQIGNLTNLERLALYNNQITSIPPEIGNLINLKSLDLSENRITSISPEIGNLINLKFLDLDYNPNLKIPPSQIRHMIQSGMNPNIIKKMMKYLDTSPETPIRRF